MPRGPFPYADLLRIRRRQEDLRAQALAAAQREVAIATAQRDALAAEQRRVLEEAERTAQHHFDAADVRRYYQYERHLARLRDEKDADIHRLRRDAAERRVQLMASRKLRRMVEKLDEWQRAAYWQARWKAEQKMLDEIAVMRHAREVHNSN